MSDTGPTDPELWEDEVLNPDGEPVPVVSIDDYLNG